ncbi:hypothetical protein [Marinicellulosiphila megalodicopiae]|uniref:hypothetical protein n=1 Tax=Marinicellulosiphila megalodicopiae TaxID=2724896 RepID=UPI003BAFA018
MMIKIALPALLACTSALAISHEFSEPMEDHLKNEAMGWINNSAVINAINTQNMKHAGLTNAAILELDGKWRSGVNSGNSMLIDSLLSNELSQYLKGVKDEYAGLYTEIFVMDNKGLNVGQSDITSDYWQGDEGKWQNTFSKGANAFEIGDLEEDESTGEFQSQLSTSIVDPATGKVIGAVTIGIAIDGL